MRETPHGLSDLARSEIKKKSVTVICKNNIKSLVLSDMILGICLGLLSKKNVGTLFITGSKSSSGYTYLKVLNSVVLNNDLIFLLTST